MSAIARLRALTSRSAVGAPEDPADAADRWPPELRALAIAIGPVTPDAWPRCERLLARVRGLEPLPVTLLVSPPSGDATGRLPNWYRRALTDHLHDGDELAWVSHPLGGGPRKVTPVLAGSEWGDAETADAARQQVVATVWFWSQGWRVSGFFPGSGCLSDAEWEVLGSGLLSYAVTASAFHLSAPRVRVRAVSGGFGLLAALRRWTRSGTAPEFDPAVPLVRVVLDPDDVERPVRCGRALRLIDELRRARWPMTHAAFARRLARHAASALAGAPA